MRALGAVIASALLCLPVYAQPVDLLVSQMYHTQWTVLNGAPTGIESLAQTSDGYLWMTTAAGLFRFDGVQFERVEQVGGKALLSNNLFKIWAPPDGGLWIGYRFGGASFVQEGRLTHYSQSEGLDASTVMEFARDESGTMWAATTRGLMRLENGRWVQAGADWNVAPGVVLGVRLDRDGVLWLRHAQSVMFLRRRARRFEPLGIRVERRGAGLVSSPDGTVWFLGAKADEVWALRAGAQPVRHYLSPGSSVGVSEYASQNTLFDGGGRLWMGAGDGLVRRLSLNDIPVDRGKATNERAEDVVALAGKAVLSTLQDREGNVWFGTSGGLDRFRAPKLAVVPFKTAGAVGPDLYLMAPADGDDIWMGSQAGDLYRFSSDAREWRRVSTGGMSASLTPEISLDCFYRDPHGDLWVGLRNEIWHRAAGKWSVSRRPGSEGSAAPVGEIQALAMDERGSVWVSVVRVGVFSVNDDTWSAWGGRTDLPLEPATVLTADPRGRLWFGYVNSRVVVLESGRTRTFSTREGLELGTVLAIAVRGEHTWVGGDGGLARFDGQAFHTVKWQGRSAPATITGIVETEAGDLWLSTGGGAVHIPVVELKKARMDPAYSVAFTLLDHLDGMPGSPFPIRPLPSMAASDGGRLWFATMNGAAWIDPMRTARNDVVPSVLVKSVTADGKVHERSPTDTSPLQLPPKTRNLQISYTATSLTIPERVQFRYRLEGSDTAWQEVGTRREAYFTDLAPGRYRFRVLASNNDGVWNQVGAAAEFVIPPTFLQSRWFLALCVAVALGVIWLVFQMRLRQAKVQLRWRLEERMVERERIARDLHDTFLQGVQGLMLRFQNVAEQISEKEPTRQLMEQALDRADQVLADGRKTVTSLRASTPTEIELPHALRVLGDGLAEDHAVKFELLVEGVPRALHPVVREEAYRIAAQALANAYQHAQATRVEALISYGRRALVVRVRDDGKGFEASPSHSPEGHWGLTGMRERAARIHARCDVMSRIGAGTSVELRIPARMAFKQVGRDRRGPFGWFRNRAARAE